MNTPTPAKARRSDWIGLVVTLLACWLCAHILRGPPRAVETAALGSS